MRFLIDECLSTELVEEARAAGYEGYHLAHIGKAGWRDWNIAAYAADNDLIVVTNNASDYLALYSRTALHPGLVVLLPSVGRGMQRILFRAVLLEGAKFGELINKVIEIDLSGDDVTLRPYDLPPSSN